MQFVPIDFKVPERLETPHFTIRKLCARDVYLDYLAVMSSIDLIKKTYGGSSWPQPDLTIEDDLIDLAWHQREFERHASFAYTVMKPDESECLGCLYLIPPHYRSDTPADIDARVSFWVTPPAYERGLYTELYQTLKHWLETDWPFKNLHWTNVEIPNI